MDGTGRTFLVIVLAGLILTAGCTSPFDGNGMKPDSSVMQNSSVARYKIAIPQPDPRSGYIRMDTDVYNAGEVVEFTVTNDGFLPLECKRTPPGYIVKYQEAHGTGSQLLSGESAQACRFVTAGWDPVRYRIISDCGIEHEILIRPPPTPVPAPTVCPAVNATNPGPWIKIDPVGSQKASRPFTIHGTTSLAAGRELKYVMILPVDSDFRNLSAANEGLFVTYVDAGACSINTWSASGEIHATGDFFIAITDQTHSALAIRRFSVVP